MPAGYPPQRTKPCLSSHTRESKGWFRSGVWKRSMTQSRHRPGLPWAPSSPFLWPALTACFSLHDPKLCVRREGEAQLWGLVAASMHMWQQARLSAQGPQTHVPPGIAAYIVLFPSPSMGESTHTHVHTYTPPRAVTHVHTVCTGPRRGGILPAAAGKALGNRPFP